MTSQEAFVSALEKLPDIYIQRLVDYIDSGKKFTNALVADGFGRGCIIGVIYEQEIFKEQRFLTNIPKQYAELERIINADNECLWGFNDANYDKPILYQLILKEAERRGLIKKELEKMEKEIEIHG